MVIKKRKRKKEKKKAKLKMSDKIGLLGSFGPTLRDRADTAFVRAKAWPVKKRTNNKNLLIC